MIWKVWEFGTSVGMRDLAALHGYVFSHAGKTWRSHQHTALTLSAAGVHDGDLVEFAGDFEPVTGDEPQPLDSVSDGEAGRSRASTANGSRDGGGKDSPKEGTRPGSRGVGTPGSTQKDASVNHSPKEGARAVRTPEGSRGVRTPDGTKKETSATSESKITGDTDVPSAPTAPRRSSKSPDSGHADRSQEATARMRRQGFTGNLRLGLRCICGYGPFGDIAWIPVYVCRADLAQQWAQSAPVSDFGRSRRPGW